MRGMQKIALWSQNIVNHFWFCCRKCGGDRMDLKVWIVYVSQFGVYNPIVRIIHISYLMYAL